MYAYDETYLDGAMRNLGEAFDYAVNACHLSADEFLRLFISSGFADGSDAGIPGSSPVSPVRNSSWKR